MNERIRELWKQAAVRDDADHTWTYDSDLHVAKFAELIVRECVSQMEWQKISPKGEGAYNSALDLAQRNIKEHFGVEPTKLEKFSRAMEKAFKDGVDLSGRETP